MRSAFLVADSSCRGWSSLPPQCLYCQTGGRSALGRHSSADGLPTSPFARGRHLRLAGGGMSVVPGRQRSPRRQRWRRHPEAGRPRRLGLDPCGLSHLHRTGRVHRRHRSAAGLLRSRGDDASAGDGLRSRRFLGLEYANVHRGTHRLTRAATERFEAAYGLDCRCDSMRSSSTSTCCPSSPTSSADFPARSW